MAYEDAFKDIIKARIVGHPTIEAEWKKHELYGNLSWINELCNRGQGPFESKESVLCYCMAYMQGHYDAARLPLSELAKHLDQSSRVAMLDIGCGPMTAALALSDLYLETHHAPIALDYIGLDTSQAMLKFAKKFARRSDCFSIGEDSYRKLVQNVSEISDRRLGKFLCKATHVVVVFNYVLSQSSLKMPQIDALAALMAKVVEAAGNRPALIAYANATWPTSWFQYFAHRCGQAGLTLANKTPAKLQIPLQQHRLADGVTKIVKDDPSTDNVEYLLTQMQRR